MNIDLTGRVAAVTHATTHTGRAICEALGRAGAVLCLGADDASSASQAVTGLHAQRIMAEGFAIAREPANAVKELAFEAGSRFGHLDIWVNVHVLSPAAPSDLLPLDAFVSGLNANLHAMFFGCQAAANEMLAQKQKGGVIINITSVAGVVALPGYAAFCAAMAGVTAVTKTLAVEWGSEGIRVVGLGAGITPEMASALAVRPKLPDGERAAHRRLPDSSVQSFDGIGDAAVYLASDAARHVNGMTLYVDSGWLSDGYWE